MNDEELIESLEKVVKELKERRVEGLKPCKNSYTKVSGIELRILI